MAVTLYAKDVRKYFGSTKAVDGVSVDFVAGQVTALVGENGAGKSTLLKTMAGVHTDEESGSFLLDDQPYSRASTVDAALSGVSMVHQEPTVSLELSIAENIFIDRLRQFRNRFGTSDKRAIQTAAKKVLERVEADFDIETPIRSLNLAERKIVEIARALSYEPQFVFLDESTAVLSNKEIGHVFKTIRLLKESNIGVVFVSHHLSEVFEIADQLVILKDGKLVETGSVEQYDAPKIEAKMVGRPIGEGIFPTIEPPKEESPVLEVRDLSAGRHFSEVSFAVRPGEIVGIAGLSGSGGDQLLRAIYGDLGVDAGEMQLQGERYSPTGSGYAMQHGVSYVPGDRSNEGVISQLSVRFNISLASIPRRGPFIDYKSETNVTEAARRDFSIKSETVDSPCGSLSGGNLQKVVIAKCLHISPRLLLLDNPTRGIDVGARSEIYQLIRDRASQGLAVVLVSEDLLEVIGLSHRVLVMKKGSISNEFDAHTTKLTEEQVITYMV